MDGEFMAAPRMRTCSNPQSRLMPIIRYVLFASAFVVALLFALDRSLPPLDAVSARLRRRPNSDPYPLRP
ncbi:hypothetical protein ACVOMS_20620 [Bradyrhizobium guangxiense]